MLARGISGNFRAEKLVMLEAAVGEVNYIIRKLSQVRDNGPPS